MEHYFDSHDDYVKWQSRMDRIAAKAMIDTAYQDGFKVGYQEAYQESFLKGKMKVKVEIALARGKQLHDKRATEKERDWQRDKHRVLRDHNK